MGSVAGSKGAFVGNAKDAGRLKYIRHKPPFAFPLKTGEIYFSLSLDKEVSGSKTCRSRKKNTSIVS